MSRRENQFQKDLKKEIEERFPGAMVLKNDPIHKQGIPDLTVLYKDRWAALECKKSLYEPYRPNQEYYLNKMNEMSFARMICPENKEDVLNDLQEAFGSRRSARVSECEFLPLGELRHRKAN